MMTFLNLGMTLAKYEARLSEASSGFSCCCCNRVWAHISLCWDGASPASLQFLVLQSVNVTKPRLISYLLWGLPLQV